jgi:two-component system sensor histidine kinase KdpD
MDRGSVPGGHAHQRQVFGAPLLVAAAHEMKSPLVLIRQLALSLESAAMAGQDHDIVRQIRLTSERSLRLTYDLTRADRLDDSIFELEPLSPIAICEEVAHELQPLFRARGRTIEVVYRRSSPLVIANRELFRRVLINFADNALSATTTDEPLRLKTQHIEHDGRVRVSLRDFGPGVSRDMWQRLSENTRQKLARRPESSGLGLFLAKQFAEAMHGTVGVVRHRDGASFFITLPQSNQLRML